MSKGLDSPPRPYWCTEWRTGCFYIQLPNGAMWNVDGRAINCGRPGEPHRCWVRSGTVPNITVTHSECLVNGWLISTEITLNNP